MHKERPRVSIRVQLWGRHGPHADTLMQAHSQQAFGSLGPTSLARIGGRHCLAPIFEIGVDDGKDPVLLEKRHRFFLDALRAARHESRLPPLRVILQRPITGQADL